MKNKITFCIVDDIDTYSNNLIRNTIRNILDYTISNLHTKGYNFFVDKDENKLLRSSGNYDYAVIMSPGTEYINGYAFFDALHKLVEKDFFIAGHILDRTMYDAYYELHHQCYVVNIKQYKELGSPEVGSSVKGTLQRLVEPQRSLENYHDDYTPKYVGKGSTEKTYNNLCHGWNLLKCAFERDYKVLVFDETMRTNKKHYYPESEKDYQDSVVYIKEKFEYCKNEFIHTDNTEWNTGIQEKYNQLVLPASGRLYLDCIEEGRVIFYDYNQSSLDYWKTNIQPKENVEYVFVYTNLLKELRIVDYLDPNLKTLVNLSNVFCYEGTVAYYSLQERKLAQDKLTNLINGKVKDVKINFTLKADAGH